MTPRPSHVSVIDPVSPAIERVKTVLFRPFDLGKWFVIGWCAFLAHLTDGGGGGGQGAGRGGGPQNIGDVPAEMSRALEDAKDFAAANLDWILPLGIFLFVFIVVLVLLFIWLSSRGRFAFLYCVAQNKGEFWNPWRQFHNEGNSLFAFRVAIGIISFLTIVGILVLGIAMLVTYHAALGLNFATIVGIISWAMLFAAAAIVFGLIGKFTRDFVVPIMYARRIRCTAAWHVLLDVLAFNKGRFFLYLLFQIVIGMAIGALVVAVACATCCCAACIFMIPYIGTVALLPVLVFTRSYSLYYLAQYGPEFDVIAPEAPAAPPTDGYYR